VGAYYARRCSSSPSMNPSPLVQFDTTEGYALARSILRPQMPYDPHSYQLAGICKVLDRKNLLAVIPTGGGKTGFIAMYLKMLVSIRTDGRIASEVRERIPEHPAVVVVVPTNGLGQEMVRHCRISSKSRVLSYLTGVRAA
jgi:superfamily II DNA or RNA helicase